MKFLSKWLFLSILCLVLVVLASWWTVFRGDKMPFSEIRWKAGFPEVEDNGKWIKIHSLSGIPMDTLVCAAIKNWGPSYQHHFGMQFHNFLESMGGQSGMWMDYQLIVNNSVEDKWSFNTRQRYSQFWENMGAARHWQSTRIIRSSPSLDLPVLDAKPNPQGGEWLSASQARKDLGVLFYLLHESYSHPERLEKLEEGSARLMAMVNNGISRRDFAIQLQYLLARLDDIHCRVAFSGSKVRLPGRDLPFDVMKSDTVILCLRAGEKTLMDPEFPILSAIQGVAIDQLWQKAALLGEAPERWMERIELVLRLCGKEPDAQLVARLRSLDGREKDLEMGLGRPVGSQPAELRVEGHILSSQIGHLRLRKGLYADPLYASEIKLAMYGLRESRGLVLDLRGNPGGKRKAVPLLLHFLLPPQAHPRILNVATYRMDQSQRPADSVTLLSDRELFPAEWPGWNARQKDLINQWTASQYPLPDPALFSSPHFMITDPGIPAGAYTYTQPVIVLIDGRTASATELLLIHLKGRPNITIMGQASTGESGYPVIFQLPFSEVQFYLPAMQSFSPEMHPITHTVPDIVFAPDLSESITASIKGQDLLLDFAHTKLVHEANKLQK